MSTTTTTVAKVAHSTSPTFKGAVTVKTAQHAPLATATSTTTTTLHTLYNRAAKAFLLRDISLTFSLIESAFAVLHPPVIIPDALADHRRKWDILRITLESTVYSSPPTPNEPLPKALQENQIKLPQDLIMTMHTRSLVLFSPQGETFKSNSAYLPSQVLITLVYSSLRVNCAQFGRVMIEGWLSRKDDQVHATVDEESKENAYERVLDLYCLEVLPKLEEWDYAQEFIEYKSELSVTTRKTLQASLRTLKAKVMSSDNKTSTLPLSQMSVQESSRSCSPAPSSASSSSFSTNSTSTVVPSTVRQSSHPRPLTSSTSSLVSRTSRSSDSTITPRPNHSSHPILRSRPSEVSSTSSTNRFTSPARSHSQASALQPSANLSIYAVIKASFARYFTTSNLSTLLLVLVVFPLLSLFIRARHRSKSNFSGVANNADLARRRLQGNVAGRTNVIDNMWRTVIQVVLDTVKMAGSGLV